MSSAELSWLTNAIAAGRDSCSIEVIAEVITGLSGVLTNPAYDEVDRILRNVRVGSINPEIMLALARTLFAARDELIEWQHFVQTIRARTR